MEESIDLRWYVRALQRHRLRLIALTIFGLVAAASIGLILPWKYKAMALVSISEPQYTLRFDGVIGSGQLPLRAYPQLALSDDVLLPVFQKSRADLPAKTNTVTKFRKLLNAEQASDTTLVQLTVESQNPQTAAQIANAWAAEFSTRAGQLYGQDLANLGVYQQQLGNAKTTSEKAAADLATFQSGNQVNLLAARLANQQAMLNAYLDRGFQVDVIMQDSSVLLTRLQTLGGAAPAIRADDMALLSVINRVYGGSSQMPIQLQVNASDPLAGATVHDQMILVQDLLQTLGTRGNEIAGQISALGPAILALQGQLATAQLQEHLLTLAHDLAEAKYKALSAKVDEAQIAAQASSNVVQIASHASVPTEQDSPRIVLNILVGAMAGLVLGLAWAFFTEWRREPVLEPDGATGSAVSQAS